MIVILQKLNKLPIVIIFIAIHINSSFAQQKECNKKTLKHYQLKYIPASVCIPDGLVMSFVFSKNHIIDFNRDSLLDFVCVAHPDPINIGDKHVLLFYKMNVDSSFSLVRKFDNVYPVYFNANEPFPKLNDSKLEELLDCYYITNPLYSLDINNDSILISRSLDGQDFERKDYTFIYNEKLQNWIMVKNKLMRKREEIDEEINSIILLSDFSYCEY